MEREQSRQAAGPLGKAVQPWTETTRFKLVKKKKNVREKDNSAFNLKHVSELAPLQ